ncbi:UTP--glucose-1-phosphate uridylyltransferase [Amycolatopsis oliviviridis]|uniref:UTP--glucose-1-phosphate uridylyltransferase n=1 Tax=Amycolatopsis oliviviridis TaxID=1471590 RepID=A0ABQ3LTA5_9PSEU|nr:UTP--glucose-1-phosphate uridylyltransferase [Amycolatopsis oliviviridis]GHH17571.1 UTP--glucose-1-phosphate uridylyltransferase [Amycolatopsis oliviviridis]
MRSAGAHAQEVAALRRRLEQLSETGAGELPGSELEPLEDISRLVDLPDPDAETARRVLDRTAVLKLNGGLGTSMGLSGPKSLLEIKPGKTFLDVIAMRVLDTRAAYGARLPLILMNSAGTREPSLALLKKYPTLADPVIPADFLQGREPKITADGHVPVEWPADPELEWCPPGHGDIYIALAVSGMLDLLLAEGIRWVFVSNADNVGAVPDARIAAWLAENDIPFAMETVLGTPADRKGGHLARRDGRIVLRESAQVPAGDDSFGDVAKWRYFNTNNIWFDLERLKALQDADPAAPELPLIVNRKTVDPTDSASTPVIQLETAMGAAIASVEGAQAIEIPRSRFAPVKTTDDLLVVRSDAYRLDDSGEMVPQFTTPPVVSLSKDHFKLLNDFDARIPDAPSLRDCTSLDVEGDVTFGKNVVIRGAVKIVGPKIVPDGEVL